MNTEAQAVPGTVAEAFAVTLLFNDTPRGVIDILVAYTGFRSCYGIHLRFQDNLIDLFLPHV